MVVSLSYAGNFFQARQNSILTPTPHVLMEGSHIVVPRRRIAITPLDAPLGEPYDLACHQFCEACMEAVIALSSSSEGSITSESLSIISLGAIRDIRNRPSCQLCKLVARAVQDLYPPYARGKYKTGRGDNQIERGC